MKTFVKLMTLLVLVSMVVACGGTEATQAPVVDETQIPSTEDPHAS